MVSDEDLKTMVREFRASVTADLDAQNRRITAFTEEIRRRFTQMEERIASLDDRVGQVDERIRIAEIAILNEIRAMTDRFDRRLERLEGRG